MNTVTFKKSWSLRAAIVSTLNDQLLAVGIAPTVAPAEEMPTAQPEGLTGVQKRRISATLARQLMKVNKSLSLSDAMKKAWQIIKDNENALSFVSFKKVSGQKISKVIMKGNPLDYYTPKGTGRPLKAGQKLYIDTAAYMLGGYFVRSFYTNNIIEQF